jgi:hypothetical protein
VVAGNVFQSMEARLCSASVEPYFVINIKKYCEMKKEKTTRIALNRTELNLLHGYMCTSV